MTSFNPDDEIVTIVKRHEGYRKFVYLCPQGEPTIGYGRTLRIKGISEPEATQLLLNDLNEALQLTLDRIPWAKYLDEDRLAVLVMMTFNLGVDGLLKFKNMLAALEKKDYQKAASEMISSRWSKQVGSRSHELAEAMLTGKL